MTDTTRTLSLAAPIQAHGETLTELTLRKPTVKELRLCGQPYRIVGGGAQCDYDACAKLISAVAGIPPSSVDQLDAADFDEAALILVGFTKRAPVAESDTGSAPKA